jgi:type IV pilus assembly protein PilW
MKMNYRQSRGFSLVELLVAMVVGLVIVSGAFSLHSTTRKTQAVNEMHMDMVADARFAIEMISYDLRHAGMWGGTNKDVLIGCKSSDAACTASSAGESLPGAVAGDCSAGWYYDLRNPVFATDDSDDNPYSASCIPASEGHVASSDILEIRYADSNVPAALQANQVYVRSNAINGRLFVGATQPVIDAYDSATYTRNHELHAYVYYISNYTDAAGDGIPSLRRVALVNGPALQNQTLVSGVADLQVQFGIDVDNDDTIDRYVDPDDVIDWSRVYAAKIWLMMRSEEQQIGIDTTKSFSVAGAAAANYGGVDDYSYFLVTSVVNLRNLKHI